MGITIVSYPSNPAFDGAVPLVNKPLNKRLVSLKCDLVTSMQRLNRDLKDEPFKDYETDPVAREKAASLKSWNRLLDTFDSVGKASSDMIKEGFSIATALIEESTSNSEALLNRGRYMLACGNTGDAGEILKRIQNGRIEARLKGKISLSSNTATSLLIVDMLVQLYGLYRELFSDADSDRFYAYICNLKTAVSTVDPLSHELANDLEKRDMSWGSVFNFDFKGAFNAFGPILKRIETSHALRRNPEIASQVDAKRAEIDGIDSEIDKILEQVHMLTKRIEPITSAIHSIDQIDQEIAGLEQAQSQSAKTMFNVFRKKETKDIEDQLAWLKESRERTARGLPRNYEGFLEENNARIQQHQSELRQKRSEKFKLQSSIEEMEKGVIDFKWPSYAE